MGNFFWRWSKRVVSPHILLALLATSGYPATAATTYSKTAELPPLRLSFSELQAILDKGAALMSAANSSAPMWEDELQLRKGPIRVKIAGHRLDPEGARIPKEIDFFEYTARTQPPASVTRLALSFQEYTRSLSVEGQSPEQVDALFSALRDDLSALSTSIGGALLKFFLLIPVPIALTVALLSLCYNQYQARPQRRANDRRIRRRILQRALICFILLSMWVVLPIDDIFAGFSAVRGEASFVVRYGPQISLSSLVLGVSAMLIPPLFAGERDTTSDTQLRAGPD